MQPRAQGLEKELSALDDRLVTQFFKDLLRKFEGIIELRLDALHGRVNGAPTDGIGQLLVQV